MIADTPKLIVLEKQNKVQVTKYLYNKSKFDYSKIVDFSFQGDTSVVVLFVLCLGV